MVAFLDQIQTYLRPSRKSKLRVLTARQALHVIDAEGLTPVRDAAHYSWDLERFYDSLAVLDRGTSTYVFRLQPINEWAPAPLFTNDRSIKSVLGMPGKNCPYWFLRLKGLDDYLARRSAISANPKRSFPSQQTYERVRNQLRCELVRIPLKGNEARFTRWYDALKIPKYGHSGEACLAEAHAQATRAPMDWFAFYALLELGSGECKCVTLVIEDGASCSGINIATARRNNGGYGVLLGVEMVRALSERKFVSFDSGVSQRYGPNKDVIFLDVLPTDCSGEPAFVVG